ncbi:hypothetical protein B0H19DRAFT_1070238 [Mycena capillaripes]|nr:hypothetical protein B0H19DRAFT_1070238 [Mycena capillaripes]
MLCQLEFVLKEHFLKSYNVRAGAASMTQPPPRQIRVSPRRSASVRVTFTVPLHAQLAHRSEYVQGRGAALPDSWCPGVCIGSSNGIITPVGAATTMFRRRHATVDAHCRWWGCSCRDAGELEALNLEADREDSSNDQTAVKDPYFAALVNWVDWVEFGTLGSQVIWWKRRREHVTHVTM